MLYVPACFQMYSAKKIESRKLLPVFILAVLGSPCGVWKYGNSVCWLFDLACCCDTTYRTSGPPPSKQTAALSTTTTANLRVAI